MKIKFFGYLHTNGSLHLKRFLSQDGFEEAMASPFVDEIYDPFEASSHDEAMVILRELAGKKGGREQ